MNNDTPLEIMNLSKFYGENPGVKNLTLRINKGEVFGFLGPNGAGKTTTIRTIMNFIKPSAGKIKIFGMDSEENSVEVKKYIGYLSGDNPLYENLTGYQFLNFLSKLQNKTDWNYLNELKQRLNANLISPIKKLSKGNKQKIGLIQAFSQKPNLLILDEPTAGLDPINQQVFYEMLNEIKKEGKTVFISSHNLHEVQKTCDRVGFIKDAVLVGIENIHAFNRMNMQKFLVRFRIPPPKNAFKNVTQVKQIEIVGGKVRFTVEGKINPFIKELAKYNILSLDKEENSLEDLFLKLYESN